MNTQFPCSFGASGSARSRERSAWSRVGTASRRVASLALVLAAACQLPAARAEILDLHYEQAESVTGPWTVIPTDQYQVQGDGRISVITGPGPRFFRLNVARNGGESGVPAVQLTELPPKVLETARQHLAGMVEPGSDEPPYALGPFATFLTAPGAQPSPAGPAPAPYVELKLVRMLPPRTSGFPAAARQDESKQGYLILSLTRDDLPVLEFSTESESPVERLLRQGGSRKPARIIRYNPTFWVSEDALGNVIASLGTQPAMPPAGLLKQFDRTFLGSADSELGQTNPPPVVEGRFIPYASYPEFKRDYLENPIFQKFRMDRAAIAKMEWDIQDGKVPPTIQIPVGKSDNVLIGKTILSFQLNWEEERPLAEIRIRSAREGGGLAIASSGLVGGAPLLVRTDMGYEQFSLNFARPMVTMASVEATDATYPKWEDPVSWYAGNWGDQCKYWQLESDKMCPVSGCGPTAWSMLFGWWDRKGVPAAFYHNLAQYGGLFQSMDAIDAPEYVDTTKKTKILLNVQETLHDLCDVWCVAGNGATPPGDMFDALPSYMFFPYTFQKLGYSYHMAWDLGPEDWNEPSKLCATAIKAERPAIVGLGWLWHYAVAYGYRRQDFKLFEGGPAYSIRRWFKCNEGWGKDSAAWYSAYDTFWGSNIHIWKK